MPKFSPPFNTSAAKENEKVQSPSSDNIQPSAAIQLEQLEIEQLQKIKDLLIKYDKAIQDYDAACIAPNVERKRDFKI